MLGTSSDVKYMAFKASLKLGDFKLVFALWKK